MRKYDTVIFDLDGTLLDTLDDLADSVNNALASCGFPCRTRDEVRRFVGNGAGRLMTLSVPGGAENPKYGACLEEFRRQYAQNLKNKTIPYDGILPLLQRLSDNGLKLAVVSNKPDAAVRALCGDYFGGRIAAAFGENGEMARKPAPEIVRRALAGVSGVAERALYVGDSEVDVETAKNAGIDFVGVTWGFRGREALTLAGAKHCIDMPEELLDIL